MGTMQFDKVLEQGIFISENEMSQMEETKASLLYKFCIITFDDEIFTKSKIQTVQDYLNNAIQNEKS